MRLNSYRRKMENRQYMEIILKHRLDNIVANREIVHYMQFLLLTYEPVHLSCCPTSSLVSSYVLTVLNQLMHSEYAIY